MKEFWLCSLIQKCHLVKQKVIAASDFQKSSFLSSFSFLSLKYNRAKVIFGLNALYGRSVGSDGSTIGPWNPNNAETLIRYTVEKNHTIYGWELGNELSGKGIGASVPVDQYASDVSNLHNLVQDIYRNFQTKPLVLGPGGFFNAGWFSKFISETSNSLQVVTHHIYNLGPGNFYT